MPVDPIENLNAHLSLGDQNKKNSGPQVTGGLIKKLLLCGLKEGRYFEYPEVLWNPNHKVLANRRLTEVHWNVGFAIYSLRLIFNDSETPQFGSDALTSKKELPEGD